MSKLSDVLAEDRRLVVLRTLTEVAGMHLNETVLKSTLRMFHHMVDRDQVRADLQWLADHGLVRVEKLDAPTSGELWLVHLRDAGQAVAEGKYHPGVARRGAE